MKLKLFLFLLIFAFATSKAYSQTQAADSTDRKFFIGSTLFMLGNFIPDDPDSPDFVQLNFGYWLTPKDVVSVEVNTWKYAWPLGIPWGSSRYAPEKKYPGYIREVRVAFAYQRFL